MQLDQTHVVVRLRTLSEIGDLAIIMIRRYPTALAIGFALGALPWAIADLCLLAWIPISEANLGLADAEAIPELLRYGSWMAVLVALQTPAAGVLTTLYLGQAVFERQPTWSSVLSEAKSQFWRWFWALGVRRMAVPAMVIVAISWGQPADVFFDVVALISFIVLLAMFRGSRPFMPEILLLERCPFRSKDTNAITLRIRLKSLHAPISSDLTSRFITVSLTLAGILFSLFFTLIFIRGIATGMWDWDLFTLLVIYPVSLWCIAGMSVFVRMLNYLDARIRLEGWEVELAVRAEAIRQFGDDFDSPSVVDPSLSGDAVQTSVVETPVSSEAM